MCCFNNKKVIDKTPICHPGNHSIQASRSDDSFYECFLEAYYRLHLMINTAEIGDVILTIVLIIP